MSGKIELSDRERAVLGIIAKGGTPTGIFIARMMINAGMDTSQQGAHRTAASLVRKGLAQRLGTSKLQWYGTTPLGAEWLRRNQRSTKS